MNLTPYQYILQQKIEKAKYLITETDQLLTHIAFDLSFSSYSNFCSVFKRITGLTPDAFRKINSAKNYFNKKY
jgi:AraC family transcriptional regulator